MDLPVNSSENKGTDKSVFLTRSNNINRSRNNEDALSSDESEWYSDVSFGWIKISTNENRGKTRNTENMASIADGDSSDSTSISDPSEHNTPDDSENEKIDIKEESNSESGDSDEDSTSSEEETCMPDDVRPGVTVNNVSLNDDPKFSDENRIPDVAKTVTNIEVSEDISFDNDEPESSTKEHQEFLKVPGNYVPLRVSGGLVLEHISDDDEVWMVQCPVFINPEDLKNKNIVFGGSSEFSIKLKNGEKQFYETSSYTDGNKPLSCLLPTRKSQQIVAKVIEPAGLIMIKEKVCVPDLDIDPVPTQRNFHIPKDLKVRHPLFGSGYQQELDTRKELTVKKKKRKAKDKSDINHKRKKKMNDDETECSSESKKQKIRRQHIPEEEEYEASDDCGVEISIKYKKNKKKKKSKNRACEVQNFDNEENITKKKKKKSKNRDCEIQDLDSEQNIPKKKKKKSKSRDSDSQNLSSEDTVSKNNANEEIVGSEERVQKKKKKHKK